MRTMAGERSDMRIRSSISTGVGPSNPITRSRSSDRGSEAGNASSSSRRLSASGRSMIGATAWMMSLASVTSLRPA
jgi:hypothetical protein